MARAIHWTAAILLALVFLAAGIWKIGDPQGAAVRLMQARVPESLSIAAALTLGISETFAGAMLLVPQLRRWGAALGGVLLIAFMVFIAVHYDELRGAECSCFPWVKRAVGPGFFVADGALLALAMIAGLGAPSSRGAGLAFGGLGLIAVIAGASYVFDSARHAGRKAPDTITAENGRTISLGGGKVFIYFFDPHCLHCLDAGRRLAALDWGTTRFIGVPTASPQFAGWFMGKAGLLRTGPVSRDVDLLKRIFPFDTPPAGVALTNGYESAMLLRFEDKEPAATLERLGFVRSQ